MVKNELSHGTILIFIINEGNIAGILSSGEDITEQKESEKQRKKLEEQLYQAQKIEAIGTLSGGIAHDFNNILTAIPGYTELATDSIKKGDSDVEDCLEVVMKAAFRAKDLVKQILQFSRHTDTSFNPI